MKVDKDVLAKLRITNPRSALLYERTGSLGPWTYSEYGAAFAHETIVPESEPRPDPPAEVVAADAALDAARLAYEAATNAWRTAIIAQRRHFDRGGRFIMVQGHGATPTDRKGKNMEAAIDRALEARGDAETVLRSARRDATRLRARWQATHRRKDF